MTGGFCLSIMICMTAGPVMMGDVSIDVTRTHTHFMTRNDNISLYDSHIIVRLGLTMTHSHACLEMARLLRVG